LPVVAVVPASLPHQPRLWSLDRLKVALTFLVIAHHVGQAYGPTGGFWAYENPERWPYLNFFFWVDSSFFMGVFFFISACFVPGSYERKGARAFLKDKFLRFGVPLLIFVLLVNPVIMYVSYINYRGGTLPFTTYWAQIYFGMGPKPVDFRGPIWPDINFGHLWFVEHLLVYAVIYAAWRFVLRRPETQGPVRNGEEAPGDLAIFGYAVALTLVTLLVRTWYPIDKWIGILGFIMAEPAHLPQYLSLFVLGMVAMRRGWLQAIAKARGLRWLWIGIGATVAAALVRYRFVPFPQSARVIFFATAESFIAAGFLVGLCTLFRERFNTTTLFWQMLGNDAYGAYLVHVPLVVALQYATGGIPLGALPKFLLVTLLGIPISFLVSHYLRKMPGVQRVL
jgi:glucans biosynthesis protein C